MRTVIFALGAFAFLSACSRPEQLPVTLKGCAGSPAGITANLRNDADRPVKSIFVSADFYSNFRFVRTHGAVTIPGGLNPGENRDVTFAYDAGAVTSASGRASRCVATHIDYLDGTHVDLPENGG